MIELQSVSKYYHNDRTVVSALHKVTLSLSVGEFVVVTGESGSGKSTLLNVISGVDSYEEGEMLIDGEPTSGWAPQDWERFRRNEVSFIFQNYSLIDAYSVYRNVDVALVAQGIAKKDRASRIHAMLARVGLWEFRRSKAAKLSGGQKQRLAIARALAKETKFIVADEPTGNLDAKSGEEIMALLHEIATDRLVVVVTHNYPQAEPYATRKIRLRDGEIVEDSGKTSSPADDKAPLIQGRSVPKLSFAAKARIVGFNLSSSPLRSVFTFLLAFLLTLIIAVRFFGGRIFYANADDLFSFDGGYAFTSYNDYDGRLMVARRDGAALSATDEATILARTSYPLCKANDALDTRLNVSFYVTDNTTYASYFYDYPSLASAISTHVNITGRLPEAENEILLGITDVYDDYLSSDERLTAEQFLERGNLMVTIGTDYDSYDSHYEERSFTDLKVVGLIMNDSDYSGVYVTQALLDRIHTIQLMMRNGVFTWNGETIEVLPSADVASGTCQYVALNASDTSLGFDPTDPEALTAKFNGQDLTGSFFVDANNTTGLFTTRKSAVVRVNATDYATALAEARTKYADRIWSLSCGSLANAVHVSQVLASHGFATRYHVDQTLEHLSTILLMVINLFIYLAFFVDVLIAVVIASLVMRSLFKVREKDDAILNTIGLDESSLKSILTMELLTHFWVSFLLILFGVLLFIAFGPVDTVRTLVAVPAGNYVLFFLIITGFVFWLVRRYRRYLAKKSFASQLK